MIRYDKKIIKKAVQVLLILLTACIGLFLIMVVWEKESIYRFCGPTESQLINIEDIDPIGYTKTPMALVTIPEDIRKQLSKKTLKQKSVRMVRSLVSYNPLKEGDVSYGYFKYVREMARENLSGEEIANSPELVHRFFDAPLF